MFLDKYVNDTYYNLILDNYDEVYLATLDENNFRKVYYLFNKINCYFINDIILNYLEIFEMNIKDVIKGLQKLKDKLGDNYIKEIGKNMTYLSEIIDG